MKISLPELLTTCDAVPVTAYRLRVGFDIANALLANQRPNRSLSMNRVREYADAMLKDRWGLTGQALIFNRAGQMMDGQHRMHAVLRACKKDPGLEVEFFVITDMDDEAFPYLDLGQGRNGAHVLQAGGVFDKNHYLLSAALGWVWAESRDFTDRVVPKGELVEFAQRHSSLREFLPDARRAKSLAFPPSMALYVRWRTAQIDSECARKFWEALVEGALLQPGDPVLLLRKRLTDNAKAKSKLPDRELLALIIKAWNLFRSGSSSKQLKWSSTSRTSDPQRVSPLEEFPAWK